MHWWISLFLILTVFSDAIAQESAKPVALDQAYVEKKLGADWKGIVFVCAPYCRFISLKEAQSWSPGFKDDSVLEKDIKAVRSDDPLYPLLVAKKPILPFVEGTVGGDEKELNKENSLLEELPPKELVAPFGFAWALQTGLTLSQATLESDTVIQSELGPTGVINSRWLQLAVMKGKPVKLLGLWTQWQGSLSMEQSLSYPSDNANLTVERSRQMILLNPSFMVGKQKLSTGYLMETEKTVASTDSLSHYGWNRNSSYLRLGYQPTSRLSLSYDYLIGSQVQEQQSFRVPPLRQSILRLNINYCSRDYSLFDIDFGFCSGASYLKDQQVATIDPVVLEGKNSTLRWTEIQLRLMLRFGEDLFQ